MKRRLRKKLRRKEFKNPNVRTRLHLQLQPVMQELSELFADFSGSPEQKLDEQREVLRQLGAK